MWFQNQQYLQQAQCSTPWSSSSTSTFEPEPDWQAILTAAAVLEQAGLLEDEGTILFGKFCGQRMNVLPREYITSILKATKALRRSLLQELKKRAITQRLAKS